MTHRVLILPDIHLTQDGPAVPYTLVKSFLREYKPHLTIILGDFMECEALSHWLESKRKLLENKRYNKECVVANDELDYIQQYSQEIVYLEGNHENWVEQYVEKRPEVEGLLEIPIRLHLKQRSIKWIPLNKLYRVGKLYFVHGTYINKYHAQKHLVAYGCNICYGHTHTAQTHQLNMQMQEPIMAYGLGCLCDREPQFMRGRPANWINQFAVMDLEEKTGRFNLSPINITRGQFLYAGKRYR